eukprot:3335084-Pyramimonas_sp.AAC.1
MCCPSRQFPWASFLDGLVGLREASRISDRPPSFSAICILTLAFLIRRHDSEEVDGQGVEQ